MKNYLGRGDAVYITAPFAVVSGQPLKVGSMFGFIGANAAAGARVALWVLGEYSVTKVDSQAWTEGALVFFDNDLKNFTTTAAVSGGIKVGVAIENVAATAGLVIGKIRLNGSF
jgi:predicted RecA/RadA family phage recombinase